MGPLMDQSANSGRKVPIDHDPEALDNGAHSAESDLDPGSDEDAFTGREHYEDVGKSNLRIPPQPSLGKTYEGSTISRAALNGQNDEHEDPFAPVEEDSDDPFAKGAMENEESSNSEAEVGGSTTMTVVHGDVPADEDEEIDSDEAFGDEDAAQFKTFTFPGSRSRQAMGTKSGTGEAARRTSESDEMAGTEESGGQMSEMEDSESDEDVDMDDDDLSSEADVTDGDSASTSSTSLEDPNGPAAPSSDREALKAILANDTATVASTLSAAAESDSKKGKAVKEQYQTFDRLLDTRIKLQKGLMAANELTQETLTEPENALAIQKAEEAALSLWSTVESIRHSLLNAQQSTSGSAEHSQKRKRPSPATATTSTADLWSRTRTLEDQTLPHHRAVLDRWSSKARAATALPAPRSQLVDRSSQDHNHITTVLDTYLASESAKLVAQASNNENPNNHHQTTSSSSTHPPPPPPPPQPTYNDTPFYQSLLRDLIASRSSTSTTTSTLLPSTTRLHPPGSKTKRVDTRASKGRKVRYTVHEKLQNFVAEEDRASWEDRARREFFGSLFGFRRVLDEDEHDGNVDVGGGMVDVDGDGLVVDGEAEALRLFRN